MRQKVAISERSMAGDGKTREAVSERQAGKTREAGSKRKAR